MGRPKGFAVIDPAIQRETARRGGIAAHAKGTAHEWTTAEAREAGRLGGIACQAKRAAAKQTVLGRSPAEA